MNALLENLDFLVDSREVRKSEIAREHFMQRWV